MEIKIVFYRTLLRQGKNLTANERIFYSFLVSKSVGMIKDAYDKEIYIKITLGQPNSKTICISFHESEYKIDYAFKNKKGGE